MYPNVATCGSAAAGSWWWKAHLDTEPQICATQGRTFLKTMQSNLRGLLSNLGGTTPPQSTDIPRVFPVDITVDGVPGKFTMAALWSVAHDNYLPQEWQDAIAADIGRYNSLPSGTPGGALSYLTTTAMAWVVTVNGGAEQATSVAIPQDAQLPSWGMHAPDDSTSGNANNILCWAISAQPPPVLQSAAQTTNPAPAGGQSVDTGAGSSYVTSQNVGNTSSSTGWVAAGIAAAGGVVGAVLLFLRPKRHGRKRR